MKMIGIKSSHWCHATPRTDFTTCPSRDAAFLVLVLASLFLNGTAEIGSQKVLDVGWNGLFNGLQSTSPSILSRLLGVLALALTFQYGIFLTRGARQTGRIRRIHFRAGCHPALVAATRRIALNGSPGRFDLPVKSSLLLGSLLSRCHTAWALLVGK